MVIASPARRIVASRGSISCGSSRSMECPWATSKPRPGPYRPTLERLREPSLEEFTEFRCRLKLRNRIQFLEGRSERVGETPDCTRLELVVLRLEVQIAHRPSKVLRSFQPSLDKRFADDHLRRDVRQFTFMPGFHLLRICSKVRCMRSTPTEMQSMSENDFYCFASTGVNTPETMFPTFWSEKVNFGD